MFLWISVGMLPAFIHRSFTKFRSAGMTPHQPGEQMDALFKNTSPTLTAFVVIIGAAMALLALYGVIRFMEAAAARRRTERLIRESDAKIRNQRVEETVFVAEPATPRVVEQPGYWARLDWIGKATWIMGVPAALSVSLVFIYIFVPFRLLPEFMGGHKQSPMPREEVVRRANNNMVLPNASLEPATPAPAAPAAPSAKTASFETGPQMVPGQCRIVAPGHMMYFVKPSPAAKNLSTTRKVRGTEPQGGPAGELTKPELGEVGAIVYPAEGCYVLHFDGTRTSCRFIDEMGFAVAGCKKK